MAMASLRQHKSSNTNYKREIPEQEIRKLFYDSIKKCFPDLIDEFPKISPLRLVGQELQNKYGDYICINVFTICEGLRRLDRKLFRKTTSRDIARSLFEAVKKENEKESMLQQLTLRDVGYITFKYSTKWMNKRIHTMLEDGIDTWAPLNMERAVVAMPIAAQNVDLRSFYIEDMLIRILDYAGVAVGRSLNSIQDRKRVKRNFIEFEGQGKSVLVSRVTGTQLFAVNSEPSPLLFEYVYSDLATLWSAIYEQEAELIVFVTPVQQREYVKKCIEAAKHEWLEHGAKYPVLLCCGYRASSEQGMLDSLWNEFECHSHFPFLEKLGKDAGYTDEAIFDCAVRYTYLKHHRLAMCTLDIDEILDYEGDTFGYLLTTLAIFPIPKLNKNLGSRGMVNYTKEFSRKERELAVHLVQFTEVIDFVCLTFNLHLVCEYIWNLCKKFRSYYYEVLQRLDSKLYDSKLFLCDATYVVMKKCFHLLGISPESPRLSSINIVENTGFEVIPLPVRDARPKELNPRFEMFSMNVHVSHPSFKMFDLFGCVSLIDTDGVLSDKRLPLDKNENGYVSYFYRDWYEAVGTINNGFIFFGNPSPRCSAPFASVLEIYVRLYATTVENDKCILICMKKFPIDLSTFWDGGLDYKRATLLFKGENGSIDFEYITLRDAMDTSMELSFDSPHDPLRKAFVKGHILAYYDGVLDGLEGLKKHSYKAVLFEAVDGSTVKVGPVPLERSVLAVPAKGILVIEALFRDVETGEVILNKKSKLHPKPNGHSKCFMPWKNCCFNLTVEWSQGSKSSYT